MLAVAGFLYRQAGFVVDESSLAVVTRFGDVTQSITEPGRHFKAPFVDELIYLDRFPLTLDVSSISISTKDREKLLVSTFASGRIVDPALIIEMAGGEQEAIVRSVDIIRSEMRKEFARRDIFDAARQRVEVLEQVREAVRPQLEALGIELLELRTNLSD